MTPFPKTQGGDGSNGRGLLQRLQAMHSKQVGVDMVYKTLVYLLRLMALYSSDVAWRRHMEDTVIVNIIDCRMLSNFSKWTSAVRNCHETISVNTLSLHTALSALSFFFRSFEQVSGDLGYIQKNVLTQQWTRQRISWHYKFYKSISLTFAALSEVVKILRLKQEHRAAVLREHVPVYSPTLSPTSSTPFPSFSTPTSPSPATLHNDIRKSCIFLLRNVLDMIVYFQWIDGYNPYPTLQYVAGLISGALGVQLVWQSV